MHENLFARLNALKRSWPVIFGTRSCVTRLDLWHVRLRDLDSPARLDTSQPCGEVIADVADHLSALKHVQRVDLNNLHLLSGGLRFAWPELLELDLRGVCPCMDAVDHEQVLDFSACTSLRKLTIECDDMPLRVVVRGLKNLQRLDIYALFLRVIEGLFNLSCLTHLHLSCPSLCAGAHDIPPQQSDDACEGDRMVGLAMLYLIGARDVVANVFLRNPLSMSNVSELALPPHVHMPELGVLTNMLMLTTLTIGEQYELTEEDMHAIGSIPHLNTLKFRNFSGGSIDDDELEHLFPLHILCRVPSCPVRSLSFANCMGLVAASLEYLHLLPSLTDISFDGCSSLHTLPTSLCLCSKLVGLKLNNMVVCYDGCDYACLSLHNALIIGCIPSLTSAWLPPPSSDSEEGGVCRSSHNNAPTLKICISRTLTNFRTSGCRIYRQH